MVLPQGSLSFYSAPNTLHYNEHPVHVSVSIVRKFGRDKVWRFILFKDLAKTVANGWIGQKVINFVASINLIVWQIMDDMQPSLHHYYMILWTLSLYTVGQ